MKKILFVLMTGLSSLQAFNQDSATLPSKWSFIIEPYLMIPTMKGTTGLGSLPEISVDANAGEIFSHLQIGAMVNVEATNGKWVIGSDIMYMSLKQDATTGIVIKSGKVTAKQFAWELAGLYKLAPWLEVGAGTMLTSIKSGVNIEVNNLGGGTTERQKEATKTWVDPMLIARVKSKPGEKFIYSLRGEIGGFGIGSDFAWQIQAYAGYRCSKLLQITAGYRVISINYDKGTGDNRFMYDMNTFGPVLRFGFNL